MMSVDTSGTVRVVDSGGQSVECLSRVPGTVQLNFAGIDTFKLS